MTYQKFNTYGKLRTVMLGSFFYPEYFSKIKNSKIREPLMRIAQEINEDLDYFSNVLTNFGVTVIRAPQPSDYFNQDDPYIAPLQVRNHYSVIGDTIFQFNEDYSLGISSILTEYCPNVVNLVDANNIFYTQSMQQAQKNSNGKRWFSKSKYQQLAGSAWPNYNDYIAGIRSPDLEIAAEMQSFASSLEYNVNDMGPLPGPNIINTEHTIYVDNNEYCDYATWLSNYLNDPRPIKQFTSGAAHTDGCFAVLGNRVILGIDPLIDYEKYFPDYKIIRVPRNLYQDHIEEFFVMKQKVNGRWWLAGEEHNNEFIGYVENHLKSWTGYISESVFDVNVLALDANTICVSNVSKDISQQLKSHDIECIVVPWRHRFFVDGGLHCITLDLYRDL
jgi:hypothetical protein